MNNKVLKTFLIFLAVFCLFMSATVCAGTEYHQTTHNVVIKTDGGNTEYVMSEGTIVVKSKTTGELLYANQFPINDDGSFYHKFKLYDDIENCELFIRDTYKGLMKQDITITSDDKEYIVNMSLETDNNGVFISDSEKGRISLHIENVYGDEKAYTAVAALYDENENAIDYKVFADNYFSYDAQPYTKKFEFSVPKNTARIKTFLWGSVNSMFPLCQSKELRYDGYIDLPNIISDNMLIQRNKPISIWGKSSYVGEKISAVLYGKNGEVLTSGSSVINNSGEFDFDIPASDAADNCSLVVSAGGEEKRISNVMVGELWVMSGQSNMELKTKRLTESVRNEILPENEIDEIRLFTVVGQEDPGEPCYDALGKWVVASPETVDDFSAVGYVAIKELYDTLNVPVGGIDTSFGGTYMAQWLAPDNPKKLKSGSYYNTKMAPLTSMSIKGIMWYQGENGEDRAMLSYSTYDSFTAKFENLITSWRNAWNENDLPVVFVQLPVSDTDFSRVRLAQLKAYKEIPNVSMAVTVDCIPNRTLYPTEEAIHFHNKIPVGKRIAYSCLKDVYGYSTYNGAGPMLKESKTENDYILLTFDNVENGLITNDGNAPKYFAVAGEDGKYYSASAQIISKDTVKVYSSEVSAPKYVRYLCEYDDGFCDGRTFPVVNLYNSAMIPCGTFMND